MPGITISVSEEFKSEARHLSWVNWSEIAREEVRKKEIFNEYLKTRNVSDEDRKFCDEIGWHPVDELPLREEFMKELKASLKRPAGKSMTLKEFNEWCKSL